MIDSRYAAVQTFDNLRAAKELQSRGGDSMRPEKSATREPPIPAKLENWIGNG
jgi:hypothetical protein